MYRGKRILAIIPARCGSKGLPDKNIRPLCGKPLLSYAIEEARKTGLFDAVFLSTDSGEYARIGMESGAEVPFLRPEALAGDRSLACDYIIHAIESYKSLGREFDYFAVLQPTSPFRTAAHVTESIHMLIDCGKTSVISVTPSSHPANCYGYLPENECMQNFSTSRGGNRQDTPYLYRLNGAIYLCSCLSYLETQTFYGPNSKAYIMDSRASLDIDNAEDFELAEWIIKRHLH